MNLPSNHIMYSTPMHMCEPIPVPTPTPMREPISVPSFKDIVYAILLQVLRTTEILYGAMLLGCTIKEVTYAHHPMIIVTFPRSVPYFYMAINSELPYGIGTSLADGVYIRIIDIMGVQKIVMGYCKDCGNLDRPIIDINPLSSYSLDSVEPFSQDKHVHTDLRIPEQILYSILKKLYNDNCGEYTSLP